MGQTVIEYIILYARCCGGKTSKTWYLPLRSRRGDLKANDHNTVLSMLTDKCTTQQGTREKRGPLHVSGA